ncbi:MAG: flagellar motor protein MotA, partial [Brevundimonas sp.]|nr:flagellar motor protein MotA [Brevundimonas sp.]
MFDIKKTNILLAMAAAGVLMAGTPVLAQDAPAADPAAATAAPVADPAAAAALAAAPAVEEAAPAEEAKTEGKMTPASMFIHADPVVKVVM